MITKYAIIFGTRPEYLKVKSIIDECKRRSLNYKVIYVKQHISLEEELEEPIEYLEIENQDINRLQTIGYEILKKLPNFISDISDIIVQGDTATSYYAAITGFQMKKKVVHIEAGLRTYDLHRPFPEEGYRQMISRIADVNYTPHQDSAYILEEEKVGGRIVNVGNTILDVIKTYNLSVCLKNIVIITFHRRENWNKIDELLIGLKELIEVTPEIQYLWYLHPNPELQQKVKDGIKHMKNVKLEGPCNHYNFSKQIAESKCMITDSGGIQEEASFMGKHCIVLRKSTERYHIPNKYLTICGNYRKLKEMYNKISKQIEEPCYVYGKGNSAKQIIDDLLSNE